MPATYRLSEVMPALLEAVRSDLSLSLPPSSLQRVEDDVLELCGDAVLEGGALPQDLKDAIVREIKKVVGRVKGRPFVKMAVNLVIDRMGDQLLESVWASLFEKKAVTTAPPPAAEPAVWSARPPRPVTDHVGLIGEVVA